MSCSPWHAWLHERLATGHRLSIDGFGRRVVWPRRCRLWRSRWLTLVSESHLCCLTRSTSRAPWPCCQLSCWLANAPIWSNLQALVLAFVLLNFCWCASWSRCLGLDSKQKAFSLPRSGSELPFMRRHGTMLQNWRMAVETIQRRFGLRSSLPCLWEEQSETLKRHFVSQDMNMLGSPRDFPDAIASEVWFTTRFSSLRQKGPDSLRSPQNDSLRSPVKEAHLEHHFSTHLGHHRPQNCERVVTGGHSLRSPYKTYYILLGLDTGTWGHGV